jgi:hypothetical protein
MQGAIDMSYFFLILVGLVATALAFVYGRARGTRRIPYRDPRLIRHKVVPPPPGTKLVNVRATNRVLENHEIRMSVTNDQGSVANIELQLMERNTDNIVETATTDANGVARVTAPTVSRVTNFVVRIGTSGYADYWPETEPRTWDFNDGIYPEVNVTVLPVGYTVPVINSPNVWVDVGGGWSMPTGDMDGLEGACGSAGYGFDEDWWVGDETMFDHVGELGPNDIWVFSGHGIDKDGDQSTSEAIAGWRPFAVVPFVGYTEVYMSDLCAKFGPDGAPGVVFLDACSSASMLDELIECCVRMAVGWSGIVTQESSPAMALFLESLLNGDKVGEAKAKAEQKVNARFSVSGIECVVKTKSWVKNVNDLTLSEVQSATADDDHWGEYEGWDDLSEAEQEAWGKLGWDEDLWDEFSLDQIDRIPWDDLTDGQKIAAKYLAYTKATWNRE